MMRTSKTYNAEKLRILSELIAPRIEELLDFFEVEYNAFRDELRGPCPVHDGDNPTGFAVITGGDEIAIRWRCFTHGCHNRDKFGANIFGLVRALLSKKHKKQASFGDSLSFLGKFAGKDYDSIQVNQSDLNKARFTKRVNAITKGRPIESSRITRDFIRKSLQIPAKPFVDRGFHPTILDRYDVGLCTTSGKKMCNRIVVPIYDDDHRYMVGCSGRTIFPLCEKCEHYHSPEANCPTNDLEKYLATKWVHSDGFSASRYLYNYWYARKHIEQDGVVILVEGPGDVWRLEQNGIRHGLAMFGTSLNDEQSIILEQSGAMNIVVMCDNDKPGREAADRLRNQLGRLYRLYFPSFEGHDVGELDDKTIQQQVKPLLKKITK